MYQWTYTESPLPSIQLPGKIESPNFWPHSDTPKSINKTLLQPLGSSTPNQKQPLVEQKLESRDLCNVKTMLMKCETITDLCEVIKTILQQYAKTNDDIQSSLSVCDNTITGASFYKSAINDTEMLDVTTASNINDNLNNSQSNDSTAKEPTLKKLKRNLSVKSNDDESDIITQEKDVQTVQIEMLSKEVQTENDVINEEKIESSQKSEEIKPVAAIPPPPPPIPKAPPMIPSQSIPKPPPPLAPPPPAMPGTNAAPVPPAAPPPISTQSGPPVPPPISGKLLQPPPPGIPPLPLPKQADWQTTISESKKCNVPSVCIVILLLFCTYNPLFFLISYIFFRKYFLI